LNKLLTYKLTTMKKMLFTLALMLMSISGFAQDAQEIINSYKGQANIQIIELNKMMIGMAAAAAQTEEEKEVLKNVDSMTMGIIGTDKPAAEIGKKLEILNEKGYGAMDATDQDVKGKIFVKGEGDYLTEVVILAEAQGQNMIMLVKGKISGDQVGSLIKK